MPFSEEQVQTVLKRYIESNDAVGVVNRGHQFILSGIKELITSYGAPSHRPEKLRRMNFGMALRLVDSLGVVTAAEYTFLERINKVRNDIDHEDHEPTPDDEAALFELWLQTLKTRDKEKEKPYQSDYFPGGFALLMSLMYNVLSHRALDLAKNKLINQADALGDGSMILAVLEIMYQHSVVKDDAAKPHLRTLVDIFRILKDASAKLQE